MVYRRTKKFLKRKDLKNKKLAVFLSSGIAVENPEKSKAKFLTPLLNKYNLHPVAYVALPGKTPGPKGELQDKTDAEPARNWVKDLSRKLTEEG